MTRSTRALWTGLAVAFAALATPDAAIAQDREWRLSSFHSEIEVFTSGDILVTETLQPTFDGSFNGIYRSIPVEYETDRGFRYKLHLDVEAVEDENGNELEYERSRDGRDMKLKIWVPGAVNATKTVVIRYRVPNGLRFFDEGDADIGEAYDELYWNVTGTEWPVPIDRASATVRLPVDVTGIRAHAFTGPYGSVAQDAGVTVEGTRIMVDTDQLGFREGLTIGVAWSAGVVERPTATSKVLGLLSANWPLMLPFLAFTLMYRRWNERGRDPEIGSIKPQYEPPENLTPAEVGVIVDNSPDMRDITATVVDLAVRGFITIEETEDNKLFGLISGKDYRFHKLRTGADLSGLESHERKLLSAFFGSRDQVDLSDLKNEFYKDLPDLQSGLRDALVHHGIYESRPDVVVGKYVGFGVVAGIAIAAIGLTIGQAVLRLAPPAVIIAAIGSALVIAGFGLAMPARTRRGAEVLRHIKGFEEFLERVETDRFKRMITGPEQFEKFLPFAMALGVESQWAKAFEGMYREPPNWYHGSGYRNFSTRVLVNDLGRMTTQTQSVMQSAPRSSSGGSSFGGGGGGGFSGGGFGGGGGGAF
jgi:hypothetical protein